MRHVLTIRNPVDRAKLEGRAVCNTKECEWCGGAFSKDPRNTYAYWRRARFCCAKCSGAHRSSAAAIARPSKADLFWRWVEKGDTCWIWAGARDKDGYGIFSYARTTSRAARVSLELDGRAPKSGELACHTCDNPGCVRPDHLYAGTPRENSADMVRRRRYSTSRAKLSREDVLNIRSAADTDLSLADRFGVSASNIALIRARLTWKHVE